LHDRRQESAGSVSEARLTRRDIAEMAGTCALPRRSGELVFHTDWERRAFAIVVSLAVQGRFEWREFQQQLIECISEAERDDPHNPSRGYYESWLASLEALLGKKQLFELLPDAARKAQ
jgi:nitrile hydratase accessory protein